VLLDRGRRAVLRIAALDLGSFGRGANVVTAHWVTVELLIASRSGAASVGISCRRLPGLRYALRCEGMALDPAAEDVALKAMRLWERRTLEEPEQWYQWKKWEWMKADAACE
jgi:hypothetical protein